MKRPVTRGESRNFIVEREGDDKSSPTHTAVDWHMDQDAAERQAEALAGENPGVMFFVLRLIAGYERRPS